jgi:CelD/BcsL family acetyltransferase involved in cellulose biosynthesis
MASEEAAFQNIEDTTLPLRVVRINPQLDPRWEALVTQVPTGLIFHHPAWLEVIEEAFGYKPFHLACEDANGQLRGILPLFAMQGLFTGRRFSSLPRTPVAGPLAYDDQAKAALLRAAIQLTREEVGTQFQLKMLTNELDGLVDDLVGVPWRSSYVLELPEKPELLRFGNSRNHAQLKRAVNKAVRQGVHISVAEKEQELREWYQLYLETMRLVFVPPRPYRFFEIVWRQLSAPGMMRLLLAKHYEAGKARIIGGLLLLMFGKTVFYSFSGWRREDQALRPNNALHWQAIHDACRESFQYYDFGEVTQNNHGLAEFKSKWGTKQQWLYRYYFPAPHEVEAGILESDSRAGQIIGAIWQKLPIKATMLLGDLAHRYF